jgi:hypothetical protein|tara:strand:+ start:6465 stop:7466 length:1002 start_codon:yes stop_codon:yes gene_type:complete
MNLQQVIYSSLPQPQRASSGGWMSFNCPCCIDNGEPRRDTRMRGGVRHDAESISYHCFNCGFTASHKNGRVINKKMILLMRNLGISDSDIKRIQLDAIREKELADGPTLFISKTQTTRIPSFKDCELPPGSELLDDILQTDNPATRAIMGAKYLIDRGLFDHVEHMYWSPDIKFRQRVILPFFQGERIVGYSARDFTGNLEAKYMMKTPKDFVYNIDAINRKRKYLIVTEGVLDAAALDGVAIMSNEASQNQIDYINMFKGEIIVSPDRDKPGEKLIKQAIENGWSVSFPRWEDDIKDAADSVQRYGKLYTLKSVISGSISNSTKINVKMRLG